MTESAGPDAAWVNEARWLRRECILAHVSLAVLLVLGAFAVRSVDARLEQLSNNTKSILAHQHDGFDAEEDRALLEKLERENAAWRYDAKGNTTTEGKALRRYIDQATHVGINGTQACWQYACDLVERDLLRDIVERNRNQADSKQRQGESRNAAPPLP